MKDLAPKLWVKIIEAPPEELWEHLLNGNMDSLTFVYTEALLAYLNHDTLKLEQCLKDCPNNSPLIPLITLRLAIRKSLLLSEEQVLMFLKTKTLPAWIRAELEFLIASYFDVTKQFEFAKNYYVKSILSLKNIGAHKKALKAKLNYVVADSHILPLQKRYIVAYKAIAREAQILNSHCMAGLALLNAARDLRQLGVIQSALKMNLRAVALMKRDFGTYQYFHAVLQLAEILIDLKREREATKYLEQCKLSEFEEIRLEYHRVLSRLKDENNVAHGKIEILNHLGELEQKLISVLSSEPLGKEDLVLAVYGRDSKIPYESLENRLNVLLNRIRKKIPGIIVFESRKFRLVDSKLEFMNQKGSL